MKTHHMEAPAPAAPRCGGHWCPRVLRLHMYEAPPGAPEGPRRPDLIVFEQHRGCARNGHELGPKSSSVRINPTRMNRRASPVHLEESRGPNGDPKNPPTLGQACTMLMSKGMSKGFSVLSLKLRGRSPRRGDDPPPTTPPECAI
jgi:hypothetical protein